MNKLAQLRQHLIDSPLEIDAENIIVFAEKGKAISEAEGSNQHFALHYQGHVIITRHAADVEPLLFFILQWYHKSSPNHPGDGCKFDAEILSRDESDLEITLDLQETIHVEETADGYQLNNCSTPSSVPLLLPAEDWQGYVNDDPTVSWVNGNE